MGVLRRQITVSVARMQRMNAAMNAARSVKRDA
jgi:hypothetical protein